MIFFLLAIPGSPKRRAKNTGNIFVAGDLVADGFGEGFANSSGFDDMGDDDGESGIETLPESRRS